MVTIETGSLRIFLDVSRERLLTQVLGDPSQSSAAKSQAAMSLKREYGYSAEMTTVLRSPQQRR